MTPLDNRDSTPADLRHPLVLAPALRRQPWPLLLLLAGCVGGSEHPIVTSETPTPDTPPDPPPETPQDPYIPPPYYPTADTSDTTAETSDTTNDGDRSHSPITEKQSRVNSHEFWKYPYLNAPLNSPLSTPIPVSYTHLTLPTIVSV